MNRIRHASLPSRTPFLAWRGLFALPAILLALCLPARAADFHVDAQAPAGGDGSLASPWNSVAQVNAHGVFSPGDNIYFQRGDTFTGTRLDIQGSGTSDAARITYGAYGTGNKPVIDPGTAGVRHGVYLVKRDYITIQDLHIQNTLSAGVACSGGHNIELLCLEVTHPAGSGIHMTQGGNILVDGCEVSEMGNGGIYCGGSDPATTEQIHDVTIQNCIVRDAREKPEHTKADGFTIHSNGAGHPCGANFVLRNNTAYNCNEQGYDLTSGTNILLENNVSYDNEQGAITIGHTASNVTIRYHRSTNEPTNNTSYTMTMSAPNVTVEYSTFIGSATQDQTLVNVTAGSAGQQPNNVTLRNNVFVWNVAASGSILVVTDHYSGKQLLNENLTIKNNIFTSRTGVAPVIRFNSPNRPLNYASYVIRNNLYDDTPGIAWINQGKDYANFAAYRAAFNPSGSWNEKSGDPLFVNAAAADFHLASTSSPAFDAGTGTLFNHEPAMLTRDPDGVPIPQRAAPDMGAFEFGGTGSAKSPHRQIP